MRLQQKRVLTQHVGASVCALQLRLDAVNVSF